MQEMTDKSSICQMSVAPLIRLMIGVSCSRQIKKTPGHEKPGPHMRLKFARKV